MNNELTKEAEIVNEFMDNVELFMSTLPPALEIKYKHIFLPGVYIRKMYAPKNAIITSKVHKTEHAFIVNQGRILVYDGIHKAVILKAPYDGVTLPGTRRLGIVLDDCIWINIHPTNIKPKDDSDEALEEALNKIEKKVIVPYKNLKLIK